MAVYFTGTLIVVWCLCLFLVVSRVGLWSPLNIFFCQIWYSNRVGSQVLTTLLTTLPLWSDCGISWAFLDIVYCFCATLKKFNWASKLNFIKQGFAFACLLYCLLPLWVGISCFKSPGSVVLCVLSSLAITLLGNRELVALLIVFLLILWLLDLAVFVCLFLLVHLVIVYDLWMQHFQCNISRSYSLDCRQENPSVN